MVGWHHRLNGHESEQTLGDSGGQGGHAAVHGGHKKLDLAEGPNYSKCNLLKNVL